MKYENNASRVRREVMIRVARAFFEGTLGQRADRIPLEMRPRGSEPTRCCIHKDRAVLKYRCMSVMGLGVDDETDELTPLSEYARIAQTRSEPPRDDLVVIDEACSACVRSRYEVTNACRGCLARPCTLNCPKDAITIDHGRARIDPDKCVNCGKCQDVCPYHAVVRVPIPCEEACPVGAITKDETGREHIDPDKCIYCGNCLQACPFGAIAERSHMLDVLRALTGQRPVIALAAPAIVGQFAGTVEQIVAALGKLGFDDIAEVALGADKTAEVEAEELLERLEEGCPLMTTSCCPAFVEAVRKHVPDLVPMVSSTPTPMHFAAEAAKCQQPEAVTVFIGPCIAKRHEAAGDPAVDYVLTFEELGAMFVAADIDVGECEPARLEQTAGKGGRGFAVAGGVIQAVAARLAGRAEVKPVSIDGLSKKTLAQLRVFAKGKCPGNFVEVMSCPGGCVAGPGVLGNPRKVARQVTAFAESADKPDPKTLQPNP